MTARRINNKRILVTRPEHQAQNLCLLLTQLGAEAVRFPVLEIQASSNHAAINKIMSHFDDYDWIIFTSRNAVNFTLNANNGKILSLQYVKVAAVGGATAQALKDAGIQADLIPQSGFNSEALLASAELQQIKDTSCLIVRGIGGRELLADTLKQRGAKVQYLEVYKRVMPTASSDWVVAMLLRQELDVIIITSVEALSNLVELLGKQINKTLLLIPLVVISDRIKKIAEEMGFKSVAVSAKPSDADIIKTITGLINGEERGRSE